MAWLNKLNIPASYTSPTGRTFVFQYENLSKSVSKKTTVFEFLDANGSYVQDLGNTGRRYPLEIIFWGSDCDDVADDFELALLERGIGVLTHPMYGQIDVIPIETIARRDNVKSKANQVVFTVVFFETIKLIYPISQVDASSQIANTTIQANIETSNKFNEKLDISEPGSKSELQLTITSLVNRAYNALIPIANNTQEVQQKFNNINRSINSNITTLVSDPIALAQQINQLTQTPARAAASITDRLVAYENLARLTISQTVSGNEFYSNDLFATGYLIGSITSVVNAQFVTRNDAIESAELILNLSDDIEEWREANDEKIDTGEAYQQLQNLVAITTGFLIDLSFSLKQERRKTIDRDRTIIDLVAELFGDIDDNLDFFITSNNLTGSEILELPRGKEIVYYI